MAHLPIRDVSLFVTTVGRGDPLLLMHGGPGLDHTTLSSLRPLADGHTLVFYDHRCNGRSTGAVESMTWENLVADAEALRQALGFEKWAVLGHSFGGMVALEYALRHPERLTRLVLMDTGGDAWWIRHNAAEIVAKRGYGDAAVRAARRFYTGQLQPTSAELFRLVRRFVGAYYYHLGPLSLPRVIIKNSRVKMRPEAHAFGFAVLQAGWTVMDRLGEIDVPSLVLAGRHDFLFPPEHQAILADRLPNARLELIERSGHNPQEEQTAETVEALRRFLAAAPPRRATSPGAPRRAGRPTRAGAPA
jgi:proline iminopeptidase